MTRGRRIQIRARTAGDHLADPIFSTGFRAWVHGGGWHGRSVSEVDRTDQPEAPAVLSGPAAASHAREQALVAGPLVDVDHRPATTSDVFV